MNTTLNTPKNQVAKGRKILFWMLGTFGALVVLAGSYIGYMVWRMNYVPTNLDTATTQQTANGLYTVSYEPSQSPIPVNVMHSWTLTVTDSNGQIIENADIAIDGDMPQHGHGLPTQPQVTQYLGEGKYLVEGLKFQMGGWWVMDFTITSNGQTDTIRFNFILD
jgi:hypothetical protein